jgi:hypothetical protein
MVHYQPAPTTALRSANYEALMEHPSTVYPYELANTVSEYMVRVSHLFMDPAKCDHILDQFLLEIPEIDSPTPIINMVDIRQIGRDLLSTISEESTRSTGSTHAITNPYEEEFLTFPRLRRHDLCHQHLGTILRRGDRPRELLEWKETPIARLVGWSERMPKRRSS